jgi:type II secretory pathway pseudopilin PulG
MGALKVKKRPCNKQAGFIAIEFMFAIIAFVVLSAIGANTLARHMDSQNYQIAAQQQQAVADAAAKYLKDYFSTVVASATPTVPVQITTAMLRNTNYLPSGFGDTNAFGQTFLVLARRPAANQLESIVLTTGGETIDEIGTREIAENLGGTGGFIPTSNTGIVQGVRGGWQIALSNYGMNPGVGHTASALFLQDGTLTNDYLYRNAVPGHPEVNTMNTSINVNGNNLNGVNTTNTTTLNATTVNTNAVNASTANISGAVLAGSLLSSGRTTVGEYLQLNGIATEGNGCGPNGLVSRNAVGLPLSCQSGVWRKQRAGGYTHSQVSNFGVPGPLNCYSPNPDTGACACKAGEIPTMVSYSVDSQAQSSGWIGYYAGYICF